MAALLVLCSACGTANASPTQEDAGPSSTPSVTDSPTPTLRPRPTPAPSPVATEDLLLVTAFADAHLVLVDPDVGEVGRIEVGRAPWGVAVAPDRLAYVATLDGVAVVDIAARERIALVPYRSTLAAEPVGGEYRPGGLGLAVSPDGSRVYVGVTTAFPAPGVLEVFDTDTRHVVATVPVGIRQFDVLVSTDGTTVYAVNHDSFDVTVVETATLTASATFRAAPLGDALGLGSWNKPHYAALSPSGTLLMAYKGVVLLELDPRTGDSTQRPLASATHSQGVEMTPDGERLLVVGDGPDDTSLAGPSLEVVDLASGASTVIPLAGSHNDVAVSPDGGRAYVSGGSSREGASYPDVVTVVDLEALEVIGTHEVPGNPLIIVPWPLR